MHIVHPLEPSQTNGQEMEPSCKAFDLYYTLSTKQYRLYNSKLKKLIMARDVVFHEDSPFYKPLEQLIFCPVSANDSIVRVPQSTGEDTDFNLGVDDVESLSSDDFDHATDEEEEGEPEHSGESQSINFKEVRRESEQVVKKIPKSRTPGQMANSLGSYWKGSVLGIPGGLAFH